MYQITTTVVSFYRLFPCCTDCLINVRCIKMEDHKMEDFFIFKVARPCKEFNDLDELRMKKMTVLNCIKYVKRTRGTPDYCEPRIWYE